MARYQGIKENPKSEESVGKIIHEQTNNQAYAALWADKKDKLNASYVSADSTPMFINLTCDYISSTNDISILENTIEKRSGSNENILSCMVDAANWIVRNTNSDGIVEVPRRSLIENFFGQPWKDSLTAFIHPDGKLVNIRGGIAFPDVQTLSYDALNKLSKLLSQHGNEELSEFYKSKVSSIKEAFFTNF